MAGLQLMHNAFTKIARFSSLTCLIIILGACGTALVINAPDEVIADKPVSPLARPPAPPPNSAAMQTLKPLGIVEGDVALLNEGLYSSERFSRAIEYAESMDSYALLVWHKGALRLEHYYKGFDAELRSETASMHKSVLGLLVAAAIEDGYIDNVDEPIGQYIQAWRDESKGKITIRQLLTMSSGLKKLDSKGGFNSETMRFYFGRLDARATVLGLDLEPTTGANFNYANTNSQLLALVLEAATNMPYTEYLSQRLWQPIGADYAAVWYFEETGFPRTFSSLLARPRDWVKVGRLIKDKGMSQGKPILSSDSMAAITSSSANNPNYGWQVWLGRKHQLQRYYNDSKLGIAIPAKAPFAVDDMVYFDGFGGQRVYISAAQDLVIVRVGDTRLDWDDSFLPNMIIDHLKD